METRIFESILSIIDLDLDFHFKINTFLFMSDL